MSEDNGTLMRRWFEEVWNKGNAEAIDELFDVDGIVHGLAADAGQPLRGPAGFKEFHKQFRNAFPDIVIAVEDVLVEGDKVAVRCHVTGSHKGEGLGFAATHKPIEISGMSIVRIRNGKIVEGWNNFDFLKLYQQIGTI